MKLGSINFCHHFIFLSGVLVSCGIDTKKTTGAVELTATTNTQTGEVLEKIVPLNDRGVPVNAATSISFTDTNSSGGLLEGNISISKATSEKDITHYVLYWGSNSTTKLNDTPITTIAKSGNNLIYTLPANTNIPVGATHLIVKTRNNRGEMATGASVVINDMGSSGASTSLSFTLGRSGSLQLPSENSPVNVDLGDSTYYTPQLVWKNLFYRAREITQNWQILPANFPLRPDGYPAELGSGQQVEWIITTREQNGLTVAILYDGEGQLKPFGARAISKTPGREVWEITDNRMAIILKETNRNNPVRRIRVVETRFENDFERDILYPEFKDHVKKFRVMRFMTNSSINGSRVTAPHELLNITDGFWKGHRIQIGENREKILAHGLPYEILVKTCNALMVDCWLNIPAMANDEYVATVARIVKEHLDPRLRVYLEYSNETWNAAGTFGVQYRYGEEEGRKYRCNLPQWNGSYRMDVCNTHNFTAKRSLEMWHIFENIIGRNHLVRIMPGQVVSAWTYKQRLDIGVPVTFASGLVTPREYTDAVAGTNYWGGNPSRTEIRDRIFNGATSDAWLRRAQVSTEWGDSYSGRGALENFINAAGNLPIVNYEGGLAFALPPSSQEAVRELNRSNDEGAGELTRWANAMVQACGRPEMYNLSKQRSKEFMRSSPKIHMISQYTATGRWSQYGCWGLEHYTDVHRHRARGLNDFIDENRVQNNAPVITINRVNNKLVATVQDDGVKQIARIAVSWLGNGVSVRGYELNLSDIPQSTGNLTVYANDGWSIGFQEISLAR